MTGLMAIPTPQEFKEYEIKFNLTKLKWEKTKKYFRGKPHLEFEDMNNKFTIESKINYAEIEKQLNIFFKSLNVKIANRSKEDIIRKLYSFEMMNKLWTETSNDVKKMFNLKRFLKLFPNDKFGRMAQIHFFRSIIQNSKNLTLLTSVSNISSDLMFLKREIQIELKSLLNEMWNNVDNQLCYELNLILPEIQIKRWQSKLQLLNENDSPTLKQKEEEEEEEEIKFKIDEQFVMAKKKICSTDMISGKRYYDDNSNDKPFGQTQSDSSYTKLPEHKKPFNLYNEDYVASNFEKQEEIILEEDIDNENDFVKKNNEYQNKIKEREMLKKEMEEDEDEDYVMGKSNKGNSDDNEEYEDETFSDDYYEKNKENINKILSKIHLNDDIEVSGSSDEEDEEEDEDEDEDEDENSDEDEENED
jgi:hypothetical protein